MIIASDNVELFPDNTGSYGLTELETASAASRLHAPGGDSRTM